MRNMLQISPSGDQTIRIWNGIISPMHRCPHRTLPLRHDCAVPSEGGPHLLRVNGSGRSGMGHFRPAQNFTEFRQTWRLNPGGPGNFEAFDTFSTVNHVLESHDRGVKFAMFHPTLPLISSAGDDRVIKIWRMSETKAREVDSCRSHFNDVSGALFHPKHELVVSCGEDNTVGVWDLAKRITIQTFRREQYRFWALVAHPNLNLFAAGHDSGLIVFKLEGELPAFSVFQDTLYCVRDKYVRSLDFDTGADIGLLNVRKFGSPYVPP
jgi:coatomer subunit alpha